MRLVLHKIVSAFTTFHKKYTILGGTDPPGLPPGSSLECMRASEISMELIKKLSSAYTIIFIMQDRFLWYF